MPRATTDALVLSALSERVFTPPRVALMLKELVKRQRANRTVDDAKLLALKKELDRTTSALDRLYEAVQEGLPMDDTLRAHTHKLQARRGEILLQMATLKDRRQLAVRKIDKATVESFCEAHKARMTDAQSGFGKAYLRLLVDDIRLEGDELKIRGSTDDWLTPWDCWKKESWARCPASLPFLREG